MSLGHVLFTLLNEGPVSLYYNLAKSHQLDQMVRDFELGNVRDWNLESGTFDKYNPECNN